MKFSSFGNKFTANAGITSLMEDLGHALATGSDMIMMGGGNPAHIPEVQEVFKKRLGDILNSKNDFQRLIGIYDPPQGEIEFIKAICGMLNQLYDWNLKPENIGLTNGSQAAFFKLFNMFAGDFDDGSKKRILLPLAPEYIGYADSGLSADFFVSNRPSFEHIDDQHFKYHVDFDSLKIDESIGAICVSRPTNPTGNVVTDEEVSRLDALAKQHDVPLIIDGAYGTPFPNIIFSQASPTWNENIILCLSLSKFGLPAARTGIVIANEDVIKAMSGINAIMNLATGSFGSLMAEELVRSGEIIRLSQQVVQPYYKEKCLRAQDILHKEFRGLPYGIHKAEGAMFLWLWLKDCPITNAEIYERLKAKGVLVVSGHYFFPGLDRDQADTTEEWQHKYECLRITYSQEDKLVERGLKIIAEELKTIYSA